MRTDLTADAYRQKQLAAFVKAYNLACDSINERGLNHYLPVIEEYCFVDKSMGARLPKIHFNPISKPLARDIEKAKGKY